MSRGRPVFLSEWQMHLRALLHTRLTFSRQHTISRLPKLNTRMSDFFEESELKRKSKSPPLSREPETKKLRTENDDQDRTDDIARQYKKFKSSPRYDLNSEELFCICRRPDRGGELMISCDGCEEWFHEKCMKLDPQHVPFLDKFFCKFCQWRGIGKTRWNKRCRRPGCDKAIRKSEKLKYCSDDCGERFIRSKIAEMKRYGGAASLTDRDVAFVVTYCGTIKDLQHMGSIFPDLPEVKNLEIEKLPKNIQDSIAKNTLAREKLDAEIKLNEQAAHFLLTLKDDIKTINNLAQTELVSEDAEDASKTKRKKSKQKKVDLCLFKKSLLTDLSGAAEAKAELISLNQISSVVESVTSGETELDGICLQDRRKCLRHNGWLNLISDQVWKKLSELNSSMLQLQRDIDETLREYSVDVYERL